MYSLNSVKTSVDEALTGLLKNTQFSMENLKSPPRSEKLEIWVYGNPNKFC